MTAMDLASAVATREQGVRAVAPLARESAVARVVESFASAHGLSRREHDVVRLAARGMATKAIASELGIGYKTVAQYWTRACQKVRCSGSAELMASLLLHALEMAEPTVPRPRR